MPTYMLKATLTVSDDAQGINAQEIMKPQISVASNSAQGRNTYKVAPAGTLTLTGGTKGTLISTNLSPANTVTMALGAGPLTTALGSMAFLPGGVGAIVITNTFSVDLLVDVSILN